MARDAENLVVEQLEPSSLVMLVDGTEEADAIAAVVQDAGVRLVRAADTITAESLFVSVLPNLIILSLDDEGASAFCDLISAIPRGSGIPVMLVGGADEALRAPIEATLRGPHTFIPRPVQRQDLLDELHALLNADLSEATRLSPPPPLSTPPPPPMGDLDAIGDRLLSPLDGMEIAFSGPSREPTQVLDDPTSPIDALLRSELETTFADPLDQGSLNLGLADDSLPGPLPWEISLDATLGLDVDSDELSTGESIDTRLTTTEKSKYGGTSNKDPDPWSPIRKEGLRAEEQEPREDSTPAMLDEELHNNGVTELSADFRRVIDEVAQRLFPEASPDEYDDDNFDDIKTVVPEVERGAMYDEDIDEFSIEAMETFSVGSAGLTLSMLEGPPTEDQRLDDDVEEEKTPHEQSLFGATDTDARTHDIEPDTDARTHNAEPPRQSSQLEPPRQSSQLEPPRQSSQLEPSREGPSNLRIAVGSEHLRYGDLSSYPFPLLLASCIVGGFDGQLVLKGHHVDQNDVSLGSTALSLPLRTVVFDRGRPVVASSGLVSDRLVERLHQQGKLADDQLERCRTMIEETGRRAGAILVELGIITTQELFSLVRWHYQEILFSCFDWRQGSFWVEPGPDLSQWRIQLEGSGQALLLEGLRRRYDAAELEGLLGGDGVRLHRRGPSDSFIEAEVLKPEERLLLRLCDGGSPLSYTLQEAGVDRGQALAALYGLELLGIVEREPRSGHRPATFSTPELSVERARLEHRIRLCREADYFSFLGVTNQASTYEIKKAYEVIALELSPGHLATIDATDLDVQLGDVRYVLSEALEVLCDESLREAYKASRF